MSMKCRCGSKDKLELKDNKIVNQDGRTHVCLGKEIAPDLNNDNDQFMKKKQAEIHETRQAPEKKRPSNKDESQISKYTRKQNLVLEEMEHVLIEEDPKLEQNVQKLGMKMKILYQGMPGQFKL